MLRAQPWPEFHDNYLWTLSDSLGNTVMVDPGDSALALDVLSRGLRLAAIFITHHHYDHIDGLPELIAHHSVPIYAPDDSRIPNATHRVAHGDKITIATMDATFHVIAVPGHTLSHVAYYGAEHLFCGDSLFSLGCGRLFEGTPQQMLASLDQLSALPAETLVCCSHEYTLANAAFAQTAEPDNAERDRYVQLVQQKRAQNLPSLPSRIDTELACNPFLRLDQANLWPIWSQQTQAVIQNRLDAFTALRRWKDHF